MKYTGAATGLFATFSSYNSLFTDPKNQWRVETLDDYNIRWKSPSANSSESMLCGGGDIGLNVWAGEGDLLFYLSRSGAFDESNMFPKLGRARVQLDPNPLTEQAEFCQELKLREGYVEIQAKGGDHKVTLQEWVEVHRPVVHVEVDSSESVTATATYENLRSEDRKRKDGERFAYFGYDGYPRDV